MAPKMDEPGTTGMVRGPNNDLAIESTLVATPVQPQALRQRLPARRRHEVFEFELDGITYRAGVGRFEDGGLAEIFLNAGKPGCQAENAARDAAILVSLALQLGAGIGDLRHSLTRLNSGRAAGPVGRILELIAQGGEGSDDRSHR